MRQIVLDTETTGLDPAQGHRIVEMAGVELINRQLTGRHLHLYLNPDRDSDPEALAVHGLTTDFLSQHPRFEEVADQLVEFVKGAEIIIHNASRLLRLPGWISRAYSKESVIFSHKDSKAGSPARVNSASRKATSKGAL